MSDLSTADDVLNHIIPFLFLPKSLRLELSSRLERRHHEGGAEIFRAGERSRAVHLLVSGRVQLCVGDEVISEVTAGNCFGIRASLFEQPRQVTAKAMGPVVTQLLPARDFLMALEQSPSFALAIAGNLTAKQGIFLGYRTFWALILSKIDAGGFLLGELLAAYRSLHPALHPMLDSPDIDLGALAYAVARLPSEVTRTSFYFLSSALPPLYANPDDKFLPVSTRARRRSAWQMTPGKLLILLRDGVSDVTDLLTCLCAYAVEAKKIRNMTNSSQMLSALQRRRAGEEVGDEVLAALSQLSPEDIDGLRKIWGDALWDRIHDILLHHEDIAVDCDLVFEDNNASATERWARQVRAAACNLVDLEDPELSVHIISSNTHSVGNCISAFVAAHRAEILAWGREKYPALCALKWSNETDLLYALMRHYTDEVPGARQACIEMERANGLFRLSSTAYTGIAVDLIHVQSLDAEAVDPVLRFQRPSKPTLIVNVDYAFGQQAEQILANLLYVFGRSVRSISVLGKAGGLVGHRGEIMLPKSTLLQQNDELYTLPNADLDAGELSAYSGGRTVHCGPVLTVAGTLLQNPQLLWFYRRIWGCVGLEMEGSYFARTLATAVERGIVTEDVRTRFAYYISDVPLHHGENLSTSMTAEEGIPPLYGITRAILKAILSSP